MPWRIIISAIHNYGSNDLSLQYQRITLSGCKEIGIRKLEFLTNTRFLCLTGRESLHLVPTE